MIKAEMDATKCDALNKSLEKPVRSLKAKLCDARSNANMNTYSMYTLKKAISNSHNVMQGE